MHERAEPLPDDFHSPSLMSLREDPLLFRHARKMGLRLLVRARLPLMLQVVRHALGSYSFRSFV
jgi:hypothetical protein